MPVCGKCSEKFSNYVKIDGKKRNLCSRRFCLKCSPYGEHNTADLTKGPRIKINREDLVSNVSTKFCSCCQTQLPTSQFYIDQRSNGTLRFGAYCKPCFARNFRIARREAKVAAIQYKGGKCQDCGFIGHSEVYDFHHIDPTKKDFEIGKYTYRKLSDKLKQELDKCVLLCTNCHRTRHALEREVLP